MIKQSWLELSEYAALAASGLGTLAAVLSNQALYAATPLTIALSLNLVNRRHIQAQARQATTLEIANLHTVLNQQQVNNCQKTEKIELLIKRLNAVSQKFNNRPEKQAIAQMTQNLEIVTRQVNGIVLSESVDLTEIKDLLLNQSMQLHYLKQQLNHLSYEFHNRPEKQVMAHLQQEIAIPITESTCEWSGIRKQINQIVNSK
ncbi:MAG: hypothetical protein WBB28_07010 [Crinalium sp.]